MDYDDHYFVFDNRLASFQGPQPISKHRPSTTASKKVASWPHRSPAPEDLARAGFFFNPQPSNPDNVRCFLCHKDLDGWEEEDDPLQEHLKHSSSCGWAICAAIELELGEVANEDPRLSYLLDARKATFANLWPYESKKGWKCKTKQLAEAGWKYTPTLESDDNTTCTYCQLALDGWESGDKPLDEHQRRSPNCPFFVLTRLPLKKQARGRAARTSKASNSRLSVQSVQSFQSFQSAQSVATITSDTQSLADPDESVLTTTTTQAQTRRKSTASTSRARKAATGTTAKGRKTRTKKDEPIVIEDSILEEPYLEPAVDDVTDVTAAPQFVEEPSALEVPAPAPAPAPAQTKAKAPVKAARGKKRTSEPVDSAEADFEAPPPKKRATRVRASNNSASAQAPAQAPATTSNDYAMFNPTAPDVDEADIEAELRALEQDMEVDQKMEDQLQNQIQQDQEQEMQVPKKGRKAAGTRKVSKQTARKNKEPAPVEESVQPEPEPAPELEIHEPEPEPPVPGPGPVPVPVQAKPKAKGRPKKVSQQPQPHPPPPPPDHDTEEDELHEDSVISIMSTDTVVRESEKPVTSKQKAKAKANPQPNTVTAVPAPAPVPVLAAGLAPPPVPKHASEPVAEAAPAPPKRGRGRPSKKSIESMRSSMGNTSQASSASTGSIVPAKITPIPPPSVPGIAIKAPEAVEPKAATKAPTEKRAANALPPLPKKRLSLKDIEEREMKEQQAKKKALEEQARQEEALRQEALRKEEEEEALREEALMEEQLQREQLQKEQQDKERLETEKAEKAEKEQRKKQAPKKQQPKKHTARQCPEEQEPHLSVAPATPHKVSPVASAKQATLSPSQSPQSSDAENQPPSSRQAAKGKTTTQMPHVPHVPHVPIPLFPAPPGVSAAALNAAMTPVRESPSKRTNNGNTLGGLRSALPWTAVDVDTIFELNKENTGGSGDSGEREVLESLLRKGTELTTPEKAMTVEEFILHNAGQAERLLKDECEAMVSQFEQQGSRAMRVLESLEAAE